MKRHVLIYGLVGGILDGGILSRFQPVLFAS